MPKRRAKAEPLPFYYIKEKATHQRHKKWAKSQKATYHKPKSKKTQKTYALLKFLKIHHKFQKFSKFSVSLLKQRVKVKPLPFYSKKRQAKRQAIKSEQSRATQKVSVMSHKKAQQKEKNPQILHSVVRSPCFVKPKFNKFSSNTAKTTLWKFCYPIYKAQNFPSPILPHLKFQHRLKFSLCKNQRPYRVQPIFPSPILPTRKILPPWKIALWKFLCPFFQAPNFRTP